MLPDDHFGRIYRQRAAEYDQMVACEDYQGNLLPAIHALRPLEDADIVEFGAGTGRLTRLLATLARRVYAFDVALPMLLTARETLSAEYGGRLVVADNARMPVRGATVDMAVAGWSFGHSVGWYPDNWRSVIGAALAEMARVLRPGGTAVILETLGTGSETPAPPNADLAAYYGWLEGEHGFGATWIRTDYAFESVDEADALTRFFFGDDLADRVVREGLRVLPECTGIWWRRF